MKLITGFKWDYVQPTDIVVVPCAGTVNGGKLLLNTSFGTESKTRQPNLEQQFGTYLEKHADLPVLRTVGQDDVYRFFCFFGKRWGTFQCREHWTDALDMQMMCISTAFLLWHLDDVPKQHIHMPFPYEGQWGYQEGLSLFKELPDNLTVYTKMPVAVDAETPAVVKKVESDAKQQRRLW